jgi:membrane-associated phospholipid phosphatase
VDRLLLWALAILVALTATFVPDPGVILLVHGSLALSIWVLARFGPRSRLGDALHAFAPFVIIVAIFETVGFTVAEVNSNRWDAFFAQLDLRLFGPVVPVWRNAFGRPSWFSDILSAFYFSYYLIPTAMGITLFVKDRRHDFDRLVFALQVTLLASYIGYFFFPTSGPRVPLEEARTLLGGGMVSEAVRLFLRSCEFNSYDAFPSGHTAASLIFLVCGWRMLPRWRAPLVVSVVGIVFSTVYLSHHYIIDLFAGLAVALFTVATTPFLERLFGLTVRPWAPAEESLPTWVARVFTVKRNG